MSSLIPSGHRHAQPAPSPAPGALHLQLTLQVDAALTGQTVLIRYPLGGVDTALIGVLLDHSPATLHISRAGYLDHDRAVPDFLRAYDGMRTMKLSHENAHYLLHRYPAAPLLEAVISTYRARLWGPAVLSRLHDELATTLGPEDGAACYAPLIEPGFAGAPVMWTSEHPHCGEAVHAPLPPVLARRIPPVSGLPYEEGDLA
ncbi:hypothetical protein [Deinococcus arcticus]|uniref:Uncharacterized protein n=1 Tax=Deinococcus arcticus TaxID=2136176 RepID=A0A2T3W3X0_9DEIO|nr:hypothetical protein [Deinococcus arcticus]PTA66600.1 hypothetical protein C8263_17000 [Deinococcus arcticus]